MNINEKITNIESNIGTMQEDISYIKKMLEELTMQMPGSQKQNPDTSKMINMVKTMLANDPNMKKRPDIQKTINDLFEVVK